MGALRTVGACTRLSALLEMTETKDWSHLPGYSLGQKWVQTRPGRQMRPGESDPGQQTQAWGEPGVCMAQSGRLPCGQTKTGSLNSLNSFNSQIGGTLYVKAKTLSYLSHDVTDVVNALCDGFTVSTDGYCPLCTIWEHLTRNL